MLRRFAALLFGRRQRPGREAPAPGPVLGAPEEGYSPVSRDTLAAIGELSRVVKNNPDAVEIYLALGNLYRAQGEIERAVQIRQNLIVRPGLDKAFKARAWFELGLDYKRGGFVDRALGAFEQVRDLAGESEAVTLELARLSAQSGDFITAARHFDQLGYPLAVAHYLVRLSQEVLERSSGPADRKASEKALDKALKVYPASAEAWLETLVRLLRASDFPALAAGLGRGLATVAKPMRFTLLEGLLAEAARHAAGPAPGAPPAIQADRPFLFTPGQDLAQAVLPVLEKQEADLLTCFYAAWFASALDREQSVAWLEKTLVLNPDFWAARLELLALSTGGQDLFPVFATQLAFFSARARELKRFSCRTCGLKREQLFFVCPRCQSWHSIAYRLVIQD